MGIDEKGLKRMGNWALIALVLLMTMGANMACASTPRPSAKIPGPVSTSDPSDRPADKIAGLKISVNVERPLRLLEWVDGKDKAGMVGLDGSLTIKMHNTSTEPKVVNPQEVHGLLFVHAQSRKETLVVNPSQCLRDFAEPYDARPVIAPGKNDAYTIDEWGSAGSMWKAPRPGKYQLFYRVRPPSDGPRKVPDDPGSPEVMDLCVKSLSDPKFWKDAVLSPGISVELKAPSRQRLKP